MRRAPGPEVVWAYGSDPVYVLRLTTLLSWAVLAGILLYALTVTDGPLPTLSDLLGDSPAVALAFAAAVYLHGYALFAYVTILSGSLRGLRLALLAGSCAIYWGCLIVVSYVSVSVYEEHHNVAAFTAFFFAILSSVLHHHHLTGWDADRLMLVQDALLLALTVGFALAFWVGGAVAAEYVFVALVLGDKFFRVSALEYLGRLRGSRLEYRYVRLGPPTVI